LKSKFHGGISGEGMRMSNVKLLVVAAMLVALGVVFPMAFHMLPAGYAGRALLPMHIPVLLAGLICGPFYGLVAGAITPAISHLTTGMPMQAVMHSMVFELGMYGLVAGLVMKFVRTSRTSFDLYIALVSAMLAGRIFAGIIQAFFLFDGTYAIGMWVSAYFSFALPGIVIQLAFIPSVVMALERERLIPLRYPIQA